MSESTQELMATVRDLGDSLGQAANSAGRLGGQAVELSDEAAGHGWHGLAARMQEVGEALEASVVSLQAGQESCEGAATELGLINDENSAQEVAGHLGTSSKLLSEAVAGVAAGLEQAEEAQAAAAEIGQEGMVRATTDLFDLVTELHERVVARQGASASERAQADAYAERQDEKLGPDDGVGSTASVSGKAGPERKQVNDASANSYGGDGRPSITIPSRPPNVDANPRGTPAKWSLKDDYDTVRGLSRENESAEVMSELGFDVEQKPKFFGKKPDYRIEGRIFDNFAPAPTKSVRNIWSTVEDKVRIERQTRRVIVNLGVSPITPDELKSQFMNWPIEGLEEVIAIKDGQAHSIFPTPE